MFETIIQETALTDDRADSVFSNKIVGCESFAGDYSWTATLRALLYDKLTEEDRIDLLITRLGIGTTSGKRISSEIKSWGSFQSRNVLHFFDFSAISEADAKKINPKEIEEGLDGYIYISRVTDLFRKNFTVFCFVNEELRTSIVVAFNLTFARYHYMQCATVGMIPWWFGELSDKDKEVLYALRGETSATYCNLIAEIAKKIGIRESFIRNKLSGFENKFREEQAQDIRVAIENTYARIKDYEDSIAQLMQIIEEKEFLYEGVQRKMNSQTGNELLEFFTANKHLDLVQAEGTRLKYIVFGYLSDWDIDMAEKFINNDNSYFYYEYRHRPCAEDWKMLLKAIFIDEELKLRFCSLYTLDVSSASVRGVKHYHYPEEYANYMPNPHIDQYECIGKFEERFRESMRNHDYITALSQSIRSGMSLNLGDHTVMEDFIRTILGIREAGTKNTTRCIELPDGTATDYKGAIEYLRYRRNENEQTD